MKTRHLILESCLLVTAFALFGTGLLSLLDYLGSQHLSQHSVVLRPDSSVFAMLMGGLLLSAIRQLRTFVTLFATLLTVASLYTLTHNHLAGGAEVGHSWISGSMRVRSEMALAALAGTLAITLSLGNLLAKRAAQAIGAAIILFAISSQLSDFHPDLGTFRLALRHAANNVANLFAVILGASIIALTQLPSVSRSRLDRPSLAAGLICTLLSCTGWYLLSLQNIESVNRESRVLLAKTQSAIIRTQADRLALIQRMSERWQSLGDLPPENLWQQEVRSYLHDFPGLGLIAVLGPDLSPLLQGARDPQQSSWLNHFLSDSQLRRWLERARQDGGSQISPVAPGAESIPRVLISSQLSLPDQPALTVVASLDIHDTMKSLSDQHLSDLGVRLYEGDTLLFAPSGEPLNHFAIQVGSLDVPVNEDRAWRLISYLDHPHLGNVLSYLPTLVLLFGLSLSGLLMLSQRVVRLNADRTQNAQELNHELQATLSQQHSLQLLNRRIMQFSRDVLCSIDKQGRFLEISPSCERVFGYKAEELIGQPYIELVLPEDRQNTEAETAAIVTGRRTHRFRNRYRHPDGRILHILWSADGSGQDETLFCVAHDITALVQSQTYTEAQRDILSLISSDHPQAEILDSICQMVEALEPEALCSILLLDETGLHLQTGAAPHLPSALNQALEGTAIGPKAGSCGTAAYRRQVVVVEDIATDPLWEDHRDLALANGLHACWSFPLLTREGKVLGTLALYNRRPYAPNQEQVEHLATAAQLATIAITRAHDRQTQQESEQRFRSLFTFNPDAVLSFDLNGHFQQVNGAARQLAGLAQEQLTHRHFIDMVVAEDAERTAQHFASACKGIPQRYETRIRNSNGELLNLDVTNLPIIVDGQIVGVYGIAKDITGRELMTDALHQALLEAEQRTDQLRGLSAAAIASARLLEREALSHYLVNQIRQVIGVHQVMLVAPEGDSGHPTVTSSLSSQDAPRHHGTSPWAETALLRQLMAVEQPICLSQHALETDPYWGGFAGKLGNSGHAPLRGLLLAPLLDNGGHTIGMLLLSDKLQDDFDQDDLAIALQFSQMAVSALENIRLLNEVKGGEQRLKSQLAFTSAITDSLSEGLLAVDSAGLVTFVNPAAEALLGTQEQRLLGQPLHSVLPLDPASCNLQDQPALEGELCLQTGDSRTLLYDARPLSSNAEHAGWVIALDDVTAQRLGDQAMRERNQFFNLSLEMFCMLSLSGHFIQVNPAFASTLRYSEEHLIGKAYMDLIHPQDRPMVKSAVQQLQFGQSIEELIIRVWDADQELHWLQLSATLSDDRVIYCAARDITERKESEKQLRLLQRSLESSYNGVLIVDAQAEDLPIIYANPAFERITGYSPDEILGHNCRFLQRGDSSQKGIKAIRHSLARNSEVHAVLRNYRKDGSPFWNDLYISPVLDEGGQVTHFVGVQNDISEERRYQDELSFNASHDVLTGLPNRTLLEDRLGQSCQLSHRYKRSVAVMFIDLDGFKQINDTNGHHFGDQVLIEVARRLSAQVRAGDTVARMGGDEFVVLLPDLAQKEDAVQVAERMLRAISRPYQIDGTDFHTSASIGITLNDGSIEHPMQLIQQADLAMYKAKQEGRNNYLWFTEDLSLAVRERAGLRGELQKAIEGEDFELYYQPQIDSRSGRVVGLEALLRWQHATRGFISPMTFIPVAEESGQIIPLSLWVLDTACRQIRQLADQGMSKLSVAVNISPVHFQRKNFLETIRAALEKYALNPEQLALEITESVLLNNTDQAIESLQQLRALGVGIAIDDFGTGYSSLGYLKRLPIDKVKIDRSFIREIISDSNDAAITRGIISMAHHLKLKVVAEGVENEPQVAFLRKSHCDQFQGYHFAKPMPFAALENFLHYHMQVHAPVMDQSSEEENLQTILLVDDEENILRALVRVLRRDGYKILTATRARDAFELLAKHHVSVILSDQRMPEMSGTEFLSRVKDLHPHTIRMVLSGYTDLKSVTEAINQGAIYKFLTKPWDDQQLRQDIHQAFQQFNASELKTANRV
ncbi:PAS domain S-box protein [Pseudomonas benzenivorans]|uniref:PAS domain S-box protein n=1 Tax=Pseudomonas benzenivorans TaxID=556533 RepID=A0ABY5H5F1_9PSED|nr:PAS domain S-box protein [Pseudomonas benzenivorans]UTW06662.1 PAS domain S-box protein [Pseudomonas benzenivorans]